MTSSQLEERRILSHTQLSVIIKAHCSMPKSKKQKFRFDYDTGQLFDLCDTAEKVVKEDHTLVEFGFQYTQEKDSTPKIPGEAEKIVVVGDIHGQFHDLHRMFAMFRKPELEKDGMWLGALTHKFMFLGDYVDRGHNSLECIVLLLALKCRFPNSYYLLRGNHESRAVNLDYGFQRELIDRFDDTVGRQLWEKFNDVFDYLPLAGLIAKKILCMHGGISSCLKHLSDIKGIIRPIKDPLLEPLAKDLLWADPSPAVDNYGSNNLRGADIEVFGKKAVTQTCDNLQLMLIIRAHQVVPNGFLFFTRQLVTIFTAPRYEGNDNNGAVAVITRDGKVCFEVLYGSKYNKMKSTPGSDSTKTESQTNTN